MLEKSNSENLKICQWCGQPSQIIWVHGHGQCSSCGYNIDECCRGECSTEFLTNNSETEGNSDIE